MGIAAFCGTCGAPLLAASTYCGACGAPVSPGGTAPAPQGTAPQAVGPVAARNRFACPRCLEVDQAAKVSAVVRKEVMTGTVGGTFAGAGYRFGQHGGASVMGGGLHLSTQSLSALGQVLAPPTPPVYRSPWGLWTILSIVAISFLGSKLAPPGPDQSVQGALICFAVVALIIGLRWHTGVRRKRAYAAARPRWEQAMRRWDELFVCLRCDGIYTPGSGALHRMTALQDVIWAP